MRRLRGYQTRMEVDGFLKEHGAYLEYTEEDLEIEGGDRSALDLLQDVAVRGTFSELKRGAKLIQDQHLQWSQLGQAAVVRDKERGLRPERCGQLNGVGRP